MSSSSKSNKEHKISVENEEPQTEIAYNIELELERDKIKEQIWMNEELQFQSKKNKQEIFDYSMKKLLNN